MAESVIHTKSYAFALRIVKAYQHLIRQQPEAAPLLKQLLRCGTSIGANVAESADAQSTADFISKRSIARKEARETAYWLHLLHDAGYLDQPAFASLHDDCEALLRLLTSSLLTLQKSN